MRKQITKEEASILTGFSARKLQRLSASGQLAVEYVTAGQQRKAMYFEDQVLALKQQRDAPELRGIAVRTLPVTESALPVSQPPAIQTTNLLTLPQAAMNVLQMLGTVSNEAGKSVSVEEIKFDRLVVGANGSTRMSGVSVTRYSARA